MKGRFVSLIVILLSVYGIAAVDAFAATLIVTKTADTADGVCDADCSLREAVIASASGDTIIFSQLFLSPQTITLTSGQIDVTRDLTITGPGINHLSVSGNNAGRILRISGGVTVNLSGMKLRDGRVGETIEESVGGAIRMFESTLNLTNMEFTNNYAFNPQIQFGAGGAVYTYENSTVTMDNVYMHGNTAREGAGVSGVFSNLEINNSVVSNNNGGGIAGGIVNVRNTSINNNTSIAAQGKQFTLVNSRIINNGTGVGSGGDSASHLTIENSIISGNGKFIDDGTGGGVINSGFAVIKNTVISNNQKNGESGGGIANTGTMYVINSSITDNEASRHGGGIITAVGLLNLTNCTVSGNVAGTAEALQGVGGGIYNLHNLANTGGRVVLTNSTVSNNQSKGAGGGLRQDVNGTATIRNSIIAANTSTQSNQVDVSGLVISEGVNLVGNIMGSSGWITADLLNLAPMLAPLGNNGGITFTHALLPGSPAINAGNNALALDPQTMFPLVFDQRGFARLVGTVDIGAYEAFYSTSPVTVGGRVLRSNGRGISGARVTLTEPGGTVRYAVTNPFGHYRFVDLTPGTTYTVTATSKSYQFTSPQIVTADQNRSDLDWHSLN